MVRRKRVLRRRRSATTKAPPLCAACLREVDALRFDYAVAMEGTYVCECGRVLYPFPSPGEG